jgi:hypothetical protein
MINVERKLLSAMLCILTSEAELLQTSRVPEHWTEHYFIKALYSVGTIIILLSTYQETET